MASGVVRLRVPRGAVGKLLGSKGAGISKGIDEVLEKYAERVEEDVLEEFLEERR
ncbi:hypothetical protein [Pyrodictium abyssi]|uniref:Uncharacterized protein n=1 Tax=Pyrodictium abyssi TaxID=54256 RepID=A0ABM8IZV7_9CREN|nr:hypothetical protein PABY_19490 [Pyrodictium abyssi]